jgi:dienelactone hydrolase
VIHLQPNDVLWPLYRTTTAPLAFRADGVSAARAWRRKGRTQLAAMLGFQDRRPARIPSRLLARSERPDHIIEKHLLRTSRHSDMPVYVLLPKGVKRPPVVVAFHGHGDGAKDAVALRADGRERRGPAGYHRDFAVALCRLGFAVAVPEIACFGERQNRFRPLRADSPAPTSCQQSAALAMHLGGTVLGMRVRDARRLVDWLSRHEHLDGGCLGAMGISGGGVLSLLHAALDRRVRALVISGYLCDWRDSLFSVHHCACNIVPGLGRFGTVGDLAGLVAPRPLLIEAGKRDPLFPISGVRRAMARVRAIYARSGASQGASLAEFDGPHRIDGAQAYPFLASTVPAPSPAERV